MITDETVRDVVQALAPVLEQAGLTRRRGGMVRGTHWAEIAGRHANGAWYELRLHLLVDGTLSAGLLEYRPLSQGGRSRELGSSRYDRFDRERTRQMTEDVVTWIEQIEA
jgi:hypothetical protein